jgi:OPT family oligopeptide transporter
MLQDMGRLTDRKYRFYNKEINAGAGILLMLTSQCLGYGFAGLLRRTLVYPTKMLYPYNLPINSLLEALYGEKSQVKKKLAVFYIGFLVLFFYEIIPQWIMPALVGVSFFCLAKRDSLLFTNLFGGSNGNEGLGILELSFDWQYISNPSPLWYPLQTLFNSFVGYVLCCVVFIAAFYGNLWDARKFPFLSQLLFTADSNGTSYVQFNQTAILSDKMEVDYNLLAQQGLPFFTTTFALFILANNLSITATFSHLYLWNYDDIKSAWAFMSLENLKGLFNPRAWNWKFWQTKDDRRGGPDDTETDPHYRLMLAYKDAPDWWYTLTLVISVIVALIVLYKTESTLPWWGFLISCALSSVCILFFGAQFAITGYDLNIQPIIQLLGGYLHPGKPVANMYFVLFGFNSVTQGELLLRDLKFAQYAKLSPRATFTMQMVRPSHSRRCYANSPRPVPSSAPSSPISSRPPSPPTSATSSSPSRARRPGPATPCRPSTHKPSPGAASPARSSPPAGATSGSRSRCWLASSSRSPSGSRTGTGRSCGSTTGIRPLLPASLGC